MSAASKEQISIYVRALFAAGITVPNDERLTDRRFVLTSEALLKIVMTAHAEGNAMIDELEKESMLMRERNTRLQRELDTALRTISEE